MHPDRVASEAIDVTKGVVASDTRRSSSSDKMLSVLDLFSPERAEWTVEEASAFLGQSESTVYRYFRSLADFGLILSIRPGRYLLGPGIVHYDRQLRTSDPLVLAAEPAIEEIARDFLVPGMVFISRIFRDHVMSIHEHRLGVGSLPEGTFARGRLAPLFSGPPGMAILASLEARAARALHRKIETGDTDWLAIKRQMRAIRASGYAISFDKPDPGMVYISVPLKHDDGGVAGSLSVGLRGVDHEAHQIDRMRSILIENADRLGQRIRRVAEP